MPTEGDIQLRAGVWMQYVGGEWIALSEFGLEGEAAAAELDAALEAKAARLGISIADMRLQEEAEGMGALVAPEHLPREGSAATPVTPEFTSTVTATAPKGTDRGLPEPVRWQTAYGEWPPMKEEMVNAVTGEKRRSIDYAEVRKLYDKYGDPFVKPEPGPVTRAEAEAKAAEQGPEFEAWFNDGKQEWRVRQKPEPEEKSFKGFATPEDAEQRRQAEEARTGKRHQAVLNSKTNTYFVEEAPEEPRAPTRFEEPAPIIFGGATAQRQAAAPGSINALIVEALVAGSREGNRRALALQSFKDAPSAFQVMQLALSISRDAQDFTVVNKALQDELRKSLGGLDDQGFQTNRAANEAATIVGQVGTGERGPGAPLPTPPVYGGQASGFNVPRPQGFMTGDLSQFDPNEYDRNPTYAERWDAIFEEKRKREAASFANKAGFGGSDYQKALAFAQNIGAGAPVSLGNGQGYVNDLSQMTPQQTQSRFGPLAGPRQADIEGMTDEQLMRWYGMTPEEVRRRRRPESVWGEEAAKKQEVEGAFGRIVAGFKGRPPLPTPKAPAVTRYR